MNEEHIFGFGCGLVFVCGLGVTIFGDGYCALTGYICAWFSIPLMLASLG